MKKVKLDKIVAISNIVSSIVLIVSIVILINEYKQSEIVNEKTIENLVYDRMMEMDRMIVENSDLAEILSKAFDDSVDLSRADSIRYLAYEHIFYDSWETLWVGFQNGVVREETWNDWNEWFIREFRKKPVLSWQGNLAHFSTLFLDYLNKDLDIIELSDSIPDKNK